MIEAICKDCKFVWFAPAIQGITQCPRCHSFDTYVAVWEEDVREDVREERSELDGKD